MQFGPERHAQTLAFLRRTGESHVGEGVYSAVYPSGLAIVLSNDPLRALQIAESVMETPAGADLRCGLHSGPVTVSEGAMPHGIGLTGAEQTCDKAARGRIWLTSVFVDLVRQLDGTRQFVEMPESLAGGQRLLCLGIPGEPPATLPQTEPVQIQAPASPREPAGSSGSPPPGTDLIVHLWNAHPEIRSFVFCALGGVGAQVLVHSKEYAGDFDVFWFPGLVFGAVWAAITFRNFSKVAAFAALSGLLHYVVATITYRNFNIFHPNNGIFLFCAFAGGFSLAVIAHLFCQVRIRWWVCGAIGLIGTIVPFVATIKPFEDFFYPLWQAAVGTALTLWISTKSQVVELDQFTERLTSFLTGPAVQVMGFIGTIAGLYALFT
ncbi:MAG: hypothetical protein JNM28_06895 [Armatimonadetes bacterium]|nr:hypothetical protein [Armatimonadota bacterium]MBS1711735.1 hypothetical protein [Armatimonadota bacterium]MBX3109711.1 hypothetical protein [Fimbriimonadaceae bacterium]